MDTGETVGWAHKIPTKERLSTLGYTDLWSTHTHSKDTYAYIPTAMREGEMVVDKVVWTRMSGRGECPRLCRLLVRYLFLLLLSHC